MKISRITFIQKLLPIMVGAGILAMIFAVQTFAQTAEIDELNKNVSDKKSEVERINSRITEYRKKISELTSKTSSLLNDLQLIENQIALLDLDIQSTRVQIESREIEIDVLTRKIQLEEAELENQKTLMTQMLYEMHRSGRFGLIETVFGSADVNELFAEVERLQTVNGDLNNTLKATKIAKERLESAKGEQELYLADLETLELKLEQQIAVAESNREAKNTLVDQTQQSEAQYRVLMSELRQEQQYITSQISKLQGEIEKKLAESQNSSGNNDPGVMVRPIDGGIITATYNDPTYPFRHLFEHSGIDIAAKTGTPVKTTAPGIIAWTRTGSSYGNYIMVIHEGGFSSLYAHLSRFNVTPEQYVSRGQVIGYVGSTGFSTGPHLHFEIRLKGIPVNPANYVSSLK